MIINNDHNIEILMTNEIIYSQNDIIKYIKNLPDSLQKFECCKQIN
mgnify:CR=1 FL=1